MTRLYFTNASGTRNNGTENYLDRSDGTSEGNVTGTHTPDNDLMYIAAYKRDSSGNLTGVSGLGFISPGANASKMQRSVSSFSFTPATAFLATDALEIIIDCRGTNLAFCTSQFGAFTLPTHTPSVIITCATDSSHNFIMYDGNSDSYIDLILPVNSQTARARISKALTATQPATARVAKVLEKTQNATAKIIGPNLRTATLNAISRIAISPSVTQTSGARVSKGITKTQGASANILACSLTLNIVTQSSVGMSWSSVSGSTGYQIWRNPHSGFDTQAVHLGTVSSGTLNYADTSHPDGAAFYKVFVVGPGIWSNEVSTVVVQSPTLSPLERGLGLYWNPNVGSSGAAGCTETPGWLEHTQYWVEDSAELLWSFRNTPVAWTRYATALKDFTLSTLNGIPLVKQLNDAPLGGGVNGPGYTFSDTTGIGNVGTGCYNAVLALKASPATVTMKSSIYDPDTIFGDLRFIYKIGTTAYVLGAFSTLTHSYDLTNNTATVVASKTEHGVTVTFTLVFMQGRIKVSASIVNNTGSSTSLDAWVQDVKDSGSANSQTYTTGDWGIRIYDGYAYEGEASSTILRVKTIATNVSGFSFSGNTTATSFAWWWATVANGSTVSDDLCYIEGGYHPFNGYNSSWTHDDTIAQIGGPYIPAFICVGLTNWVLKNTSDSTTKTALDAVLAATYARCATLFNPSRNAGWLLWCYAVLAVQWPSNSTYTTNRDVLLTAFRPGGAFANPSEEGALSAAALGVRSAGDSSRADYFIDQITPNASDAAVYQAMNWLASGNKQSSHALLYLSYLLRLCQFDNASQQSSWTQYNAMNGTTEAMAFSLATMADIRHSCGDVTPIRIGRTTQDYGTFSDGLISGYSWNSDTQTFSITVDRDVWFWSSRGCPTAVKRSGTTLTLLGSDPGMGVLADGAWYFDASTNVIKVGASSSSVLTLTMPAPTIALSLSNQTIYGCDLTWSSYQGADFASYAVYRGTNPVVSTSDMLLVTVSDPLTVTYTDTSAAAGQKYYYAILLTGSVNVWSDVAEYLNNVKVTATSTACARISMEVSKTQIAESRIIKVSTNTQSATAKIAAHAITNLMMGYNF